MNGPNVCRISIINCLTIKIRDAGINQLRYLIPTAVVVLQLVITGCLRSEFIHNLFYSY